MITILNSIPKFKKQIGSGLHREAYYSKKYDVVVKTDHEQRMSGQTAREISIFKECTAEEREFFPVIDIVHHHDKTYLVMKKCTPVCDIPNYCDKVYGLGNSNTHLEYYTKMFKSLELDLSFVERFVKFLDKFNIGDMHYGNMGIYNNHLVVIDAGY